MWTTDNEDGDSVSSAADDDGDGGLGKKALVDGLIAAVRSPEVLPAGR